MISVFFLGLVFSFIGYTPPSVLNMTALKIRIQQDKKDFYNFTFGVLLIVLVQAYLSVYLTKYIAESPMFISFLEKMGIVVLMLLSIYFYKQNQKEKHQKIATKKMKNSFFMGMILSLVNMFAIPFYCGIIAFLVSNNLMYYNTSSTLFFAIGSILGTFFILFLYGKFAKIIQKKTGKLIRDINLILSILTGFVAVFTLIKLFINS